MKIRLVILSIVTALIATALAAAGTTATKPPPVTLPTKPMSAEDAAVVEDRAELIVGGEDLPGLLLGVWDPRGQIQSRQAVCASSRSD